ncbi:putative HicB family RNase H-like nuclease [Arthrobacter sp. GAS37]|uniref:type II toxin-antitoxin system HicB family antitoxin n=1 Tax=Arthrobacter sp. GAS37 TaxID=3156261 RepID=UPI003834EB42
MQTRERPAIEHYRYTVAWSPEDEEHVAQVAEFPSLSWLDESIEGAIKGLERLVGEVVEDMLSQGETVPVPLAEREYSGNLKIRVSPETHRFLVASAQEQGVSLNRFLVERILMDAARSGQKLRGLAE